MGSKFKNSWKQCLALVLLSIGTLICSMVYSIQAPFYPSEAEKKNATSTEYGIVFGIYELTIFISSPIIPGLMENISGFTTFHLGIYTVAVSVIAFGFLDQIRTHLPFILLSILLRICEALGGTLIFTTNNLFVAELFPETIGTVFGILQTMFASGLAFGPPIGGALYQLGGPKFGFTLPFLVLGCTLGILTIFTCFILPKDEKKVEELKHSNAKFGFRFIRLLKIPLVQLFTVNIMCTALAVGFLTSTLEPHIRQFNLSSIETGGIFLSYGGVYALTALLWGYICDRISQQEFIPIVGSIIVLISFMFVGPLPFLGINTSIYLVAGSLVCFGVGLSAIYVSSFLLVLKEARTYGMIESNIPSYVSGLWLSSIAFGAFIGPILGGFLLQTIGFGYGTILIEALFIIMIFWHICAIIGTPSRTPANKIELTSTSSSIVDNEEEMLLSKSFQMSYSISRD